MVIIEQAAQRVFVLITPMNYEALVGCMNWAEDFLPNLIKQGRLIVPSTNAPRTHNIHSKMKKMSKLGKDYCKLLLSVLFIQARL
jgi:hypothetical protein